MSYKSTLFKALFFTLAILPIILSAQSISLPQLSEKAFVSVITCSATPDYEGGFGHSALRIQDATLNIDVIFNFGSYSDKQPFFAYKILQGTVISYLDGEPFKKFADRYKNDGRGINLHNGLLLFMMRRRCFVRFGSVPSPPLLWFQYSTQFFARKLPQLLDKLQKLR